MGHHSFDATTQERIPDAQPTGSAEPNRGRHEGKKQKKKKRNEGTCTAGEKEKEKEREKRRIERHKEGGQGGEKWVAERSVVFGYQIPRSLGPLAQIPVVVHCMQEEKNLHGHV